MSGAEEYFHLLTGQIKDAVAGKMFGALCMKMPNGKAAAMFWKDNLVVRLSGKAREEALSLDGAALFDPMGGRPMKEWVQIPFEYKSDWKRYAQLSSKFVALLEKPSKKSNKKTVDKLPADIKSSGKKSKARTR